MRVFVKLFIGIIIGVAGGMTRTDVSDGADGSKPLTGGQGQTQNPKDSSDAIYRRTILIRPKPATLALRSTLYPGRDQMQAGAAAPIFLRQNFEATAAMKTLRETHSRDWNVPLDDLDVKAVREGTPLRWGELRRAAFRERAGWEYPLAEERAAFILLPDVQESRLYVHAILLAARADLKEGKVTEAADKICIATGLARHIGETPLVICRLVQSSNLDRAMSVVEELLQHPAAENQYWSLTSLPRPLISTQDAFQFEATMMAKTFPMLASADSRLTEQEWLQVARDVVELVKSTDGSLPGERTPEAEKMLKEWIVISRMRLAELRPEWAERVAKMSDAEVGARYWFERVRSRASRQCALATLEYTEAIPRLIAEQARLQEEGRAERAVQSSMMEPLGLVRVAALADQRVALLRTIEAIRDWSSKHEGQLPGSLDQLELPAPRDCISNGPLQYARAADGKSATLAGAELAIPLRNAAGESITVRRGFRYDLTLSE